MVLPVLFGQGPASMSRAAGAVIKKLFNISYDPSQVGRLLKKVGWSRQKPQAKARQQNALAVAQWRQDRLPELKKSPS